MERGPGDALRRAARRRAPGGAAAPRRRHQHDRDGGCVRRGRRRRHRRPRHQGAAPRLVQSGRDHRARLLQRRAQGLQRLPAVHRPGPAGSGRVPRLPIYGDGEEPRAPRAGSRGSGLPAQPRSHRLHERRGVEGHDRSARRGVCDHDRRGPRPGQRLHARPHRLPRELRRRDRLDHDHPQPVRALAHGHGACRPRAVRREGAGAGARLRRGVPRRSARRGQAGGGRPPQVPPRWMGG